MLRHAPVAFMFSLAVVRPAWGAAPACEAQFNGGVIQLSGGGDASRLNKEDGCTASVVKTALARPSLRGVTVTALATDEDLASGKALAGAKAIQQRLETAGLAAPMLASVALRVTDSKTTTYRLNYREIPEMPVASVVQLEGEVRAGASADQMRVLQPGGLLRPGEFVDADGKSSFAILFTDGHTLRAMAGTLLQLLPSSTANSPRAEVVRGRVEVLGKGKSGTALELKGYGGVAAVRGTQLRFTLQPDGTVRLETLDGKVDLTGARTVPVATRQGSRVFKSGVTEDARALLPPPAPNAALQGPLPADGALGWTAVEGARSYVVMLAQDADFSVQRRELAVPADTRVAPPADLPAGRWYWAVMAVDPDGFVGVPSRTFTFTR